MANPQETSVKDFDLKKEICFDSIIIKLYDVPAKCKCNRNIVGENEKRGVNMANKRCKSFIRLAFYRYWLCW